MSSRSLGTLTVDLVLKTIGLTQGADKAERELDKRAKALNAKAKAIGRDIGLGLSAISGVAIAGLTKYIANTIEAEKVQAQLASRIKDTGAAAGRTIEQLNEQADQLQSVTIFDDEAIGNVQAMLLTFKEIQGVNFDQATAAVLDLSTAMGMDAQSAALQLGKALNDPIKGLSALSRAGVQFSKDQREAIKAMVEAGDVAGAQRVILAELEGQMGSAAEAARNTLGGALQSLKNSFDNLLEGDTGGAGLKGTVDAINDLSDTLNDPQIKEGVDTIAEGLLRIGSAALQAVANLGTFAGNVNKVLANAGLVPGKELEQLKKRRDGIEKALGGSLIGKLFPDTVKGELDRIDKEISAYPFKNVVSSVSRAAGEERAAAVATGGGGGARSGGGGSRAPAVRELPNFTEEDRRALEEQIELVAQATREFDSLSATLSGPLAEAEFQHKQNLADITALGVEAGKSTEEISALKELEIEQYKEKAEAIKNEKTEYETLIEDLEFEYKLIGMSNEAREIAIAQRYADVEAMSVQGQKIAELTQRNLEAAEAANFMKDAQEGLADAFTDVITGSKSAKEAFGDFADELFRRATQMVMDKAIQQLFSSFGGTSSASSSGGGTDWMSLLGSFFGGGMATGGTAMPRTIHEVNELGFEMATVGGRDYMLTGNRPVEITPNNKLGGGGFTQVVNNNYREKYSARTQQQAAADIAFRTNLALRRNS